MQYITETRGGYDEWSDKYQVVLGLKFEDGDEIRGKQLNRFTDLEGNQLKVELPQRKGFDSTITIERYDPTYDYWEIPSLSLFSEFTNLDNETIDITALQKEI